MFKHSLAVYLLIIMTITAITAQPRNQRDAAGLRQGLWEAVDNRGMPVFRGYFKDDKPVGEMMRFFPNGEIRAIMYYVENSELVRARFFWQADKVAAQGNYISTKRDSIWNFYRDNGTLSTREEFSEGKRNGIEQKFYQNGINVAEEINWIDDTKEGVWKQFYNNGLPKLLANYSNGVLVGAFASWYPNGHKELEGYYDNGLAQGDWKRYDENGDFLATIKYEDGVILNIEELEKAGIILNLHEPREFIPERTIEDLFR